MRVIKSEAAGSEVDVEEWHDGCKHSEGERSSRR